MTDIEFEMEDQLRSNWCWAAVTASVERFFSGQSELRQCGVAHAELNLRCCEEPERRCNQVLKLDLPLKRIGRLRGEAIKAILTFPEIRQEIDKGLPVGVRIGWRGGGGHFVIISGYDLTPTQKNMLIVDDPKFKQSRVPYERLVSRYQGVGEWTHTFHFKRKPGDDVKPSPGSALGGR